MFSLFNKNRNKNIFKTIFNIYGKITDKLHACICLILNKNIKSDEF